MSGITDSPKKLTKDHDYVIQGSTVGEILDSMDSLPRDATVDWVDFYEEKTLVTRKVTVGIGVKYGTQNSDHSE